MTMTLPAPLIPADVDLKGMDYMPIYIERLRRSRGVLLAAAEAAAGFSMILLWQESWWSDPAGSLENDDLTLAAAARCSRDEWKKRKPVALYGWKLCSDGRLYHPVVCDIAWETWQARLKHMHKMACDRIAKANKRAIDDAHKPGQHRRHVDTKPIPSFEAWVTCDYPATAARLFAAAAAPAAPAPATLPAEPGLSPRQGEGVEQKPPDVGKTEGVCPSETALKSKCKGKISPPTPPCGGAATTTDTGKEWERNADFAAFMNAVGQPDAPTATCWRAWLDAVRAGPDTPQWLPERRELLARVAAWRHHCAQEAKGKLRYRPMGPARLLREGTLASFAEQAAVLLGNEAAIVAIEMAESERTDRVRDAWGDLYAPMLAMVGDEPAFMAWFGEAWPERTGGRLSIFTRKAFVQNWIKNHYQERIERALGCGVEVILSFERAEA